MTAATPHRATGARRPRPRYPLPAIVLLVLAGIAIALVGARVTDNTSSGPTASARGSGAVVTEPRAVPAFAAVELAGANNVTIRVGGAQSVAVHAQRNLLQHVVTEVHDGTLVVGSRGTYTATAPLSVDVTVPALSAVALTGTGSVHADGIQAGTLVIRVPGSGTVTASGSVDRLDAGVDGAAEVELGNLVARDVTAALGGTGHLHVHATRSLEATVSGTGTISYGGNPATVSQSVTGTGSIAPE